MPPLDKSFTSWPTVAPATADATYTALYEDIVTGGGNIIDVFMATGQSNAAWPWDSVNSVGTFGISFDFSLFITLW